MGQAIFTYLEPEPSGEPDDSGLAESVHISGAVRRGCTQEAASSRAIVRNFESHFHGLKVLNNSLPWKSGFFGSRSLRWLRPEAYSIPRASWFVCADGSCIVEWNRRSLHKVMVGCL